MNQLPRSASASSGCTWLRRSRAAWLPLETYPISAGVKGGWAGSIAMAVLACIYGLLKTGSIWYPINLLAAGIYTQSMNLEPAQLNAFHAGPFVVAVILHGLVSTLVGLLYGAMLPMFPRHPHHPRGTHCGRRFGLDCCIRFSVC